MPLARSAARVQALEYSLQAVCRWVREDAFYRMFRLLAEDSHLEYAMVDGTIAKAHRHGQGGKERLRARPLGVLAEAQPARSWR